MYMYNYVLLFYMQQEQQDWKEKVKQEEDNYTSLKVCNYTKIT